jgi:hypothetical protein
MPILTLFPPATVPPALRRERLRDALRTTVDLVNRDRADLIAPGFVDDYLALDWLEDRGGGLRLTPAGAALCLQIAARVR